MPPLLGIVHDIIDGDISSLDFRATSKIDDFCTHEIPRRCGSSCSLTIVISQQAAQLFATPHGTFRSYTSPDEGMNTIDPCLGGDTPWRRHKYYQAQHNGKISPEEPAAMP